MNKTCEFGISKSQVSEGQIVLHFTSVICAFSWFV